MKQLVSIIRQVIPDLIRNVVAFSLKLVYIKIFITLLNTYHGHEQNP